MRHKVEAGDTLIVKADQYGPTNKMYKNYVLEKEAQASGFISIYDAAGTQVDVIGGVYMKINASNFSSIQDPMQLLLLTLSKKHVAKIY